MPTTLTFRIFKGAQLIREEKLTQAVIKLGKVPSAHLRLDDEAVSRMHAIIEVSPSGEASLIDLGSTRGTFVNGQKINKAMIKSGDVIVVGDTRLELAIAAPEATVVVAPQVAPPPLPRPAPVPAPMPMMAMPAPRPTLLVHDDEGGAGAVEVAAMLGDSVVDVKHCVDPQGGKITSTTWGYFAAGVVALISAGAAVAMSVHNVAVNKAALATWTTELHRPAGAFRPAQMSVGYDWLAFGGFAVALAALAMGLVRMRRERQRPSYTIGTAPGVDAPLEQAPAASFALVAPRGDDFVFTYAPGIEGEMTVDGKSTPLAAIAGQPSAACAGAMELAIPPRARIRAKAGQTTFLVSAVAKPRTQAVPLFALEGRMLKYAAGSLAVHLGIWAFLQTVPQDGTGANIDLATNEEVGTHATITDHDKMPDKPIDETGDSDGPKDKQTAGAMALGPQGTAGDPKTESEKGGTQIKNNDAQPQLAREQAMQQAREAGILGSTAMRQSISALTGVADFSSGFDDANFYGPEFGAYGNGKGSFGLGRSGFGTGGGCTQEPCGVIGAGRYGTIGDGTHAGDGWGGNGGHGGMRQHHGDPPGTIVGTPIGTGGLDKAIIKRYVKRASDKISYCYEKQLLAHPGLAGELMVQFVIQGDGTVKGASGKGFDSSVASCVSEVVGAIAFPKPSDGGVVQVNYPFTFHATGA